MMSCGDGREKEMSVVGKLEGDLCEMRVDLHVKME